MLILREVLRWKADEVAELLDTTVASVNSALQRARATLAEQRPRRTDARRARRRRSSELLARYVDAFERYDIDSLDRLLHEDATHHMPPSRCGCAGAHDIAGWMLGPGTAAAGRGWCRSGQRLAGVRPVPPTSPAGGYEPWALHVLEISDGQIAGINSFLDTDRLFPLFGLPLHLDVSTKASSATWVA